MHCNLRSIQHKNRSRLKSSPSCLVIGRTQSWTTRQPTFAKGCLGSMEVTGQDSSGDSPGTGRIAGAENPNLMTPSCHSTIAQICRAASLHREALVRALARTILESPRDQEPSCTSAPTMMPLSSSAICQFATPCACVTWYWSQPVLLTPLNSID
jgi:hypothetical protein